MKSVVISGGSSGIGAALAHELKARGYRRIALTARRAEKLSEVADSLSGDDCEVMTIACDIRDADMVRDGVERLIEAWGVPDMAIANAGLGMPTPTRVLDLDAAHTVMHTNFDGMLHLFAPVVPGMVERGSGHIAGVASLAGLRGLPGGSMYSSSKAAMQAWLEAARVELMHRGVSVTIVNPGWVDTPLIKKNRHPMPFMMSAERAARIICDGLERRARVIEFPLPMSILMRVMRAMPGFLFDRFVAPFGKARASAGADLQDSNAER